MASSSLQQAKAMPPVLTVSQLVSEIKSSLEHSFRTVDLEAEISNWRPYPSGHCYFSLKDSGAQISAVLFASVPCDCRDRLCDGRRVKVRAQVTLYPQRGDLQLKILRIKVAGEGELMAQYLALKAKLEAEGLFDRSRKRPLPPMPRRIGLVTSPAGAVVHDMCRVLTRRFRNLEIRLFPAQVQGVDAPRSLIAGLAYFNSLFDGPAEAAWRPDLVIVARGGGSFEDLFCFNDEGLVRAIAASRAPVISAVGHETDYTLCDFAADKRAGTPSIAAETAVPELAEVRRRIQTLANAASVALRSCADARAQHLDRLSGALSTALEHRTHVVLQRLAALSPRLSRALKSHAEIAAQKTAALASRLPKAAALSVERAETKVRALRSALALLSPFSVLDRGYSLTTDSAGRVIRDATLLSPGDAVSTRLAKGSFASVVKETAAEGGNGAK